MKPIGFKHYGGINNSFTYHHVELSFFNSIFFFGIFDFIDCSPAKADRYNNQQTYILSRWQKHLAISPTFRSSQEIMILTTILALARISDLNLADVSFFRLKNLSLAYNIGQNILNSLKMKEAKIFVQGQNLFTISNFKKMLDPETGNALPPLRIIMAGVQLKF